jgi:hypothetical protein
MLQTVSVEQLQLKNAGDELIVYKDPPEGSPPYANISLT